jgi:hypothetical protein
MRDFRCHRIDGLAPIFVDIDDKMRRLEGEDLVEGDILGAADLGHAPHRVARMDAKTGSTHHLVAQPEREQQLGQARHQADDARVGSGDRVHDAEGVAPRAVVRHRSRT